MTLTADAMSRVLPVVKIAVCGDGWEGVVAWSERMGCESLCWVLGFDVFAFRWRGGYFGVLYKLSAPGGSLYQGCFNAENSRE